MDNFDRLFIKKCLQKLLKCRQNYKNADEIENADGLEMHLILKRPTLLMKKQKTVIFKLK